jgi:hypothetical protein
MQSNVLQAGPILQDAVPMADEAPAGPEEMRDLEAKGQTTMGLVELLLKQPEGVDILNRRPAWQRDLFPRFLLIAESSFLVYALIMVLLLNLAPAAAFPQGIWFTLPPASWADGTCLGLILAYTLGILLAASVCLPSFYFYSLLAGVKISWLQISSLIGKGTAANGVMLLGILPIYLAVALGLIVFDAPAEWLAVTLNAGLALPFLTGLWGLRSIYVGILDISENLPQERHCHRQCFLRRLIFSWAGVYALVVPVMIYRLWEFFAAGRMAP